ncbi:hypothetical protein BDQ94DRAFT_133557 [Aspergillus welwitschiae]|uniref:Uncharacterized protein n=1 Tax=Aspergillus welwitschiae TaxID=1341132 RepID=A0A3F3QKR9_9EURO|nr:hypothetical protein BDQ94DRAFT_133557 [Aspergillus welwitschiae]RDH39725.1 hypothetical protein BDQ94DRAFT_133557 [Aspergillus welwitschiae]
MKPGREQPFKQAGHWQKACVARACVDQARCFLGIGSYVCTSEIFLGNWMPIVRGAERMYV